MNEPKVTIGLPIYNGQAYMDETINSILNQSYENFELIIIDDGSSDQTQKKLKELKDPRVRVIIDNKNLGLPNRLNQITQMAKGEFIARMDADDIMTEDRIEKQVSILQKNSDIDVLGSNAYSIDEENCIVGIRRSISTKIKPVSSFIHPSIMGKSSWFKSNPYNPRAHRCEDFELWFRTRNFSNFYAYETPLLFYREFGGVYYTKYIKSFKGVKNICIDLFLDKSYKLFFNWIKGKVIPLIIRIVVYFLLNLFGLEYILIKKRNIDIQPEQMKEALKIMNSISRGYSKK